MIKPIDDLYLEWLYGQVANPRLRRSTQTYWILFRQLYKKEFAWIIPNDDNRLEDGRDLRDEFLGACEEECEVRDDWLELGCSMLELFIAISRRLSFEGEGDPAEWFWVLIGNLELGDCTDSVYEATGMNNFRVIEAVDETLDRVIWRTYSPAGLGGLFPLQNPTRDQREVELWYQLSAYLLERV